MLWTKLGLNKLRLRKLQLQREKLKKLHLTKRHWHIQPKIRQQLQVLRDLGLVEFLGGGSYRLR